MRAAAALVLLAACAPPALTPAGARVVMVAAPAPGCALVASLRGSAGYNGRSGETNAADVEHYLRNQAAERGGDAIVVTSRQLGAPGADGDSLSQPRGARVSRGCPNCVSMTASAYRCPAPRVPAHGGGAPTAAPAPAPAPAPDQEPPFSTKASDAAIAAAAESARRCKGGGPAGEARVKVTFAGTGDVVYAEVLGDPFAGTPVGDCIARKFRNARVPAFSGAARSVETTVRMDE